MHESTTPGKPVTAETPVEELVERLPGAVQFFGQRGIRLIRCGEPVWATVGELLRDSGVENPDEIIRRLNELPRTSLGLKAKG